MTELLVAGNVFRGLRLATLAITAGTLYGLALPLLLANPDVYRSLPRQWLAFAVLTVVVAVVGVQILRDRPLGRPRWVLVAAVFAASALATTAIPAEELMSEAEWSYGVIGWFGLLLLVDHSALATAVFLGVHTVGSFGQLVATGQGGQAADLVVVTAVVLGCELPVLAAAMALRSLTARTAAAAERVARMRTADAIAEQLHADRRARYGDLATSTVPLLTDLKTGAADLSDDRVRTTYAVAAARLRRLFAEHDEVVDPLLHELRACLDLAERNGVTVYLGSCGEHPTPPLTARRALTEPVLRALAAAGTRARVTVLGSSDGVTVSVVADAREVPGPEPEPTGGDGVTVTRLVDGKEVWVEATWQART
ncbi:hypothetical protein [Actinophytocola sp. NPDC049390]|uniref:hypothetical protein n=1 Tax=Actinophytocola sp. NPDC049390 TaxID=3363894 RepID=UPI0037A0D024